MAVVSEGWDCSSGQVFACSYADDLAAGESIAIRVTTSVAVAVGGIATNTAVVEVTGPVPETDLSDNVDSAIVAVDELPRTGADLVRFAALGFLLLAAGAALLRLSGSRRRTPEGA